jgi:pyruvate dehydrogenase E1 component alpha subunit
MARTRQNVVAAVVPDLDGVVQLVDPNGTRLAAPGYEEHVVDLGHDALRGLYEDMKTIRRLDTEATALQRQGQLGLWPPLLGQEAAQIGSARALRPDDFVFTSYREHGVAYCRGARPIDLVRVWRGVAVSGWNPFDINMASTQVVIGAQVLHATGYAMGIQKDGADSVAVAYLGDGAMSEGDVSEAMVFAASFKAPVIFFVQNNHWAISEPVALQTTVSLADRGLGFGIPSLRVDGNDIIAVTAATRIALDRARRGDGPTLIEAVTYRMGPHTTADDPTRYRPEADLAVWGALDPLTRLEALLLAEGALSDEFRAQVTARAEAAAAEMRAECLALADPQPLSIFDHVYAGPHVQLDAQRAAYARYLDSFDGGAA